MFDPSPPVLEIAAPAPATAIAFAPPLDLALHYVVTEERGSGAAMRRFRSQRHVTFRRIDDGYEALVVLNTSDQSGAQGPGDLFMAAMGSLHGMAISFRIDRQGRIVAVPDQARHWAAICDAIDTMAPPRDRPAAAIRSIAAPLRALPPDRVTAILGSMLQPLLIDPQAGAPTLRKRPVSAPARGPGGEAVTLTGEEDVVPRADGLRDIVTTLAGDVVAAAPGGGTRALGRIEITGLRRHDPATGLIVHTRRTRTTRLATADPAQPPDIAISTVTLD